MYPEYKDDRVCFLPLFKTRFLQVAFFFFTKKKDIQKVHLQTKEPRQYDCFIYSYFFSVSSLYFNF